MRFKVIDFKGKKLRLQIFDTVGQERFRWVTKRYYTLANGAFVVFDVTDKESFNHIDKWINEIKEIMGDEIEIIILGNKSELIDQRAVTTKEAKEKADLYSKNNKLKFS